ncbi:hypothetical protein SRABI106_03682 [Rahnella aquatilis]|nr:hypothetical protein SRABI106_03682 [Rahnella aquatilis]
MDHHAVVFEGDQFVSLITVRQKRTGHRFTDNQPDHRMPGQTRFGVSACGTGQRLMDTERFFTAAISLTWHVDDRHDGAFGAGIRVGVNHVVNDFCQIPAFEQTDFAARCTRILVIFVRHHGDETYRLVIHFAVSRFHGRAKTGYRSGVFGQFSEPVITPAGCIICYVAHARSSRLNKASVTSRLACCAVSKPVSFGR